VPNPGKAAVNSNTPNNMVRRRNRGQCDFTNFFRAKIT
jgi:hypothetical protein